jgi:filamentous hemagglutinin
MIAVSSTTAVSLINNKGDLGAVLNELGSKENTQNLLLTMATAGLTNGILNAIPVDGANGTQSTLAAVNANSSLGQLLGKNVVQSLTASVLQSAILGTDLEEAIKSNLKGALINTAGAQAANEIGGAKLEGTSKALAHALLGCAIGSANAGNNSGRAPGASGAVIGELVANWCADATGCDQLKIDAVQPGADAALVQRCCEGANTLTELEKKA